MDKAEEYKTFKVNGNAYRYKFSYLIIKFDNIYIRPTILIYKNETDYITFSTQLNIRLNQFKGKYLDEITLSQVEEFLSTGYNSVQDAIFYFLLNHLKKYKWDSIENYIKYNIYPLFSISRDYNIFNKNRTYNLVNALSNIKNDINKKFATYLELSKDLAFGDKIEISGEELENMVYFFEEIEKPNNVKFVKDIYDLWHKRVNVEKNKPLNRLLIYLIFIPNKEKILVLFSILNANKYFLKNPENILNIFINSFFLEIDDFRPLRLSNIEVEYILKTAFNADIHIDSIKKYCKEMNLKTYNPKKGYKINREDIKHPYLEKDFLEELEKNK